MESAIIIPLRRQEQGCEFEASLSYRKVSGRVLVLVPGFRFSPQYGEEIEKT